MKDDQSNQEHGDTNTQLAELRDLIAKGDFDGVGRSVLRMDLGENQTLAILGGLCWEANASKPTGVNTNSLKAALVIIEALVQRKEGEILLKLGGISWRGHENSPVSLRCLQAALDLGPLDELYDYVQRWPKDSSSPELWA